MCYVAGANVRKRADSELVVARDTGPSPCSWRKILKEAQCCQTYSAKLFNMPGPGDLVSISRLNSNVLVVAGKG
jgi:hypothetical protein